MLGEARYHKQLSNRDTILCSRNNRGRGGGGGGGREKVRKSPLFFSHVFSLTTPVLCRLAILWQTCGTTQLLQNANLAFNVTSLVLGA